MNSVATPLDLPRVPHVSDQLLKDHHCFMEADSRFRRACRLLQVLWLKDRGIETGVHVRGQGPDAVVMPLHSNLSRAAADRGQNFLNQDIHAFVRKTLVLAEEGACIDTERLFSNAVSSVPTTWNLFAPLALDLELATAVFRILFPAFVKKVEHVAFETAPLGRRTPEGLTDGTAFDVAVYARDADNRRVGIFFEIKLTEEFPANGARQRPKYDEVARSCGLFVDPDSAMLRSLPLEQFFRELMLSQRVVDSGTVERAMFVAVAPRLNRSMQAAFRAFRHELTDAEHLDDDRVPFMSLTMESLIDAIRGAGAPELAHALYGRYCDFERIYHLALQEVVSNIAPTPIPAPTRMQTLITPRACSRSTKLATSSKKSRLKVSAR